MDVQSGFAPAQQRADSAHCQIEPNPKSGGTKPDRPLMDEEQHTGQHEIDLSYSGETGRGRRSDRSC